MRFLQRVQNSLEGQIDRGDFSKLHAWLNVGHGRVYSYCRGVLVVVASHTRTLQPVFDTKLCLSNHDSTINEIWQLV